MEVSSGLARDDSFDTVDDEFRTDGRGATAATDGVSLVKRQSSTDSDNFSAGGEASNGEGFWGRQCDPESGMAYYLNEKVGVQASCFSFFGGETVRTQPCCSESLRSFSTCPGPNDHLLSPSICRR